jgi:hypothetical protein
MAIIHPDLGTAQAAEEFIHETGGLPEIMAAAEGLFAAIEQTRDEITNATFAPSRFPTELDGAAQNRLETYGSDFSPMMRMAIDDEGQAGAKRFQLQHWLTALEGDAHKLIQDLLGLRTDLVVSQHDDFSEPLPTKQHTQLPR